MTSTSFADVAEEGEDEGAAGAAAEFVGGGLGGREAVGEGAARGGGSGGRGSGCSGSSTGGSGVFRPCLSRASLAASDEGGETDFADQTMSEVRFFFCFVRVRQVQNRRRLEMPGSSRSSRQQQDKVSFCSCSSCSLLLQQ